MAMSERAIRNWEIKQLRQMWQQAKLLCEDPNHIQFYVDEEIVKRGGKPERERMNRIAETMKRSGAVYDKVPS